MNPDRACPVRNVVVDLASNSIALFPGDRIAGGDESTGSAPAVLDIGQRGRLIGIELESCYFAVSEGSAAEDELARSVEVSVSISRSVTGGIRRVELPRAGVGYEIAFPIGNQCWRQHVNGTITETCVVTIPRRDQLS
jgi:hypothetical protein